MLIDAAMKSFHRAINRSPCLIQALVANPGTARYLLDNKFELSPQLTMGSLNVSTVATVRQICQPVLKTRASVLNQ